LTGSSPTSIVEKALPAILDWEKIRNKGIYVISPIWKPDRSGMLNEEVRKKMLFSTGGDLLPS
jgi:hypothetical protein